MKSAIQSILDMQKGIDKMFPKTTLDYLTKVQLAANPYKNMLTQMSRIGEPSPVLRTAMQMASVPERVSVMGGTATIPKAALMGTHLAVSKANDLLESMNWFKTPEQWGKTWLDMSEWNKQFSKAMQPQIPFNMQAGIEAMDSITKKIAEITKPPERFDELINVSVIVAKYFKEGDWSQADEIALVEDIEKVVEVANNAMTAVNVKQLNSIVTKMYNYILEKFDSKQVFFFFLVNVFIPLLVNYWYDQMKKKEDTKTEHIHYYRTAPQVEPLKIAVNSVEKDLRLKPRTDYASRYCIPVGTELTVIKLSGKWAEVSFKDVDGKRHSGWIFNDGLE
jgi:hypothetical protein